MKSKILGQVGGLTLYYYVLRIRIRICLSFWIRITVPKKVKRTNKMRNIFFSFIACSVPIFLLFV